MGRVSTAATKRDGDGVELKHLEASLRTVNYDEAGK